MYLILVLPLLTGLIVQLIKFFINSNKLQFNLNNFFAYGGMPSGHASLVVSLTTIIGLELGLQSPFFAISLIVAILTIRDALGLRQYLGQHGQILNKLVKDLDNDHVLDQKYPHLLEKIGHTPTQVLIGAIIGFMVSLIGFLLL
jgi:uncharacterized protein